MNGVLRLLLVLLPALCASPLYAQVIWYEPFNYPDMTMMGANLNTANPAADWVTDSCPTCLDANDWFEVRNNVMEGHDTNGPGTLTTERIDISAWPIGVEVRVDLSGQGSLEGCTGQGCNSTDYIKIETKLDNGPYQEWLRPTGGTCNLPCTGGNFVTLGAFTAFTFTQCPFVGDSLRIRISVQNWANDEYLRIDNITVAVQTCNPFALSSAINDVSCFGANDGSLTLSASGAQPPYTFSLNGGPFQSSPTFSGLAPGTYYAVVQDFNGALDTLGNLVVSEPSPLVVGTTATPTGCSAAIGSASAIPSGGTPGYSYAWSTSPVQTSATATGLAAGSYIVTVTDLNGCTAIDTATVSQPNSPTLFADPGISTCTGDSGVQLGATATGGNPPYTWFWTCINQPCYLSSSTAANPIANPPVTTTYFFQATDSGGCSSNLDSLVVFVEPTPVAEAGPDLGICPGDTAFLNGSASGAGPIYAFSWSPASSLNDPNIPDPFALPPAPTWYQLTVTSGACSASDSVFVDFSAQPIAFAGSDSVICRGDSIWLDGDALGQPNVSFSYLWLLNGDTLNADGSDSVRVAPTATSTFVLLATANPGCTSEADSITVFVEQPFVHPIPEPVIEFCPGEPLQLGVAGESGYTYRWSPIVGLQDPHSPLTMVAPEESISYELMVTSDTMRSENCRTQNFPVAMTAGNCLLPNVFSPNGDGINDVLDFGPYFHNINLVVYDRWGKEVFRARGYQNDWNGTHQNGQELPEGVYFYRLEANVVAGTLPGTRERWAKRVGEVTLLR